MTSVYVYVRERGLGHRFSFISSTRDPDSPAPLSMKVGLGPSFKSAPKTKTGHCVRFLFCVRERGLEPPRREAYAPHAYVYTNFTTRAIVGYYA